MAGTSIQSSNSDMQSSKALERPNAVEKISSIFGH